MPPSDDRPRKRPTSCDLCRLRKVKCVKDPGMAQCQGCDSLNLPCEYTHKRRKPGPTSRYAKQPTPTNDGGYTPKLGVSSTVPPGYAPYGPSSSLQYTEGIVQNHTVQTGSTPGSAPPLSAMETDVDWSWLPLSRVEFGSNASIEDPSPQWTGTSSISEGPVRMPQAPSLMDKLPSASTAAPDRRPSSPKRARVEDVMPWTMAMRILQGYHAYLYPLMPIMHWPSFLQKLVSREDERSCTWRAYLFSLLAYSIAQLPRSALSFLPATELRRLHQRCFSLSRSLRNRNLREVSSQDIATLYCQHIYTGSLGQTNAANVILASAIRLALALNFHDERSDLVELDCIERQVRRRIFWLLYGSDRTIAALTSAPMQIAEADVAVPLPLPVDDDFITKAGAFAQPPGTTSILSGFYHVSRIFSLLGAILTAVRARTSINSTQSILGLPPSQPYTCPPEDFEAVLDRTLADLPEPLQMESPHLRKVPASSSIGQRQGGDGRVGSDAFAICKANCLVTQALARVAIHQYATALGEGGDVERTASTQRHLVDMLESMSSESLAANGDSLRAKVLYFVACGILDLCHDNTDGPTYVSEFLSMYARLREEQQANILLENVESQEPSRSPSPFEPSPPRE